MAIGWNYFYGLNFSKTLNSQFIRHVIYLYTRSSVIKQPIPLRIYVNISYLKSMCGMFGSAIYYAHKLNPKFQIS